MTDKKNIFPLNFFRQPCNYFTKPWRVTLFNTLLSAFMLFFYEPFGFHLRTWTNFMELLIFACIAACFSFLFFYIFPRQCNIYHRHGQWTIGKNLIYLSLFLLCTGIGIFLFDFHIICNKTIKSYGTDSFYQQLFTDLIGVYSIGVIPLSISYLLEKTHLLRESLDMKEEKLEEPQHTDECSCNDNTTSSHLFKIECENKKSVNISPDSIAYIESAGNYVCLYGYNDKKDKIMIRSTLTRMEEELQPYPWLVRCHRTFMVNVNFITQFSRQKEGYRISIQNYNEKIPVSRTYLSQMKELLNK